MEGVDKWLQGVAGDWGGMGGGAGAAGGRGVGRLGKRGGGRRAGRGKGGGGGDGGEGGDGVGEEERDTDTEDRVAHYQKVFEESVAAIMSDNTETVTETHMLQLRHGMLPPYAPIPAHELPGVLCVYVFI